MKRITIIGAGFAALSAARKLRQLDAGAEITLIAPKADDLRIPLDRFMRDYRIRFVAGEATELENGGRTVLTNNGKVVNDGLIIACGGRFIKKLPGIEHAILPCEGIAAAEKLRERVAALEQGNIALGFSGNPNEPTAIRGGPIFEFLFGLDTQLRRGKRPRRGTRGAFSPRRTPRPPL